MARELHTMEAIVSVYHVYKEIWCAAKVIDHLLRDQLIDRAITMAMPPANHAYLGCENLHVGIYFTSLIFVVCQSTVKTAKIGPHKNFLLYSTTINVLACCDRAVPPRCETFMYMEINMSCILCHTISESMISV